MNRSHVHNMCAVCIKSKWPESPIFYHGTKSQYVSSIIMELYLEYKNLKVSRTNGENVTDINKEEKNRNQYGCK